MLQCKTCGGTYDSHNPDGTEYYHACPPFSLAELKKGLTDKTIALSAAHQKRVDDAKAADVTTPPLPGAISREDLALLSVPVERPNKRDENIRPGARPDDADKTKAPGAGVLTVAAPVK